MRERRHPCLLEDIPPILVSHPPCIGAPVHQCTNAPCTNAPMNKCTNAPVHQCTAAQNLSNAQMHKCTNACMDTCTNVQMHYCTIALYCINTKQVRSLHKIQVKSIALCADFSFAQLKSLSQLCTLVKKFIHGSALESLIC